MSGGTKSDYDWTLEPISGWKAAHVGFDHDDLTLGGLPVWSLEWRQEKGRCVTLGHPAYPDQLHAFSIYRIDDGKCATRFAAAELSNTVWGFYRWQVPADAPEGLSADGSLGYAHTFGEMIEGRNDAADPSASLFDAVSGETLFDGAGWQSSRIVPQAHGAMLLTLEQNHRQDLFAIEPTSRTFRDVSGTGAARPLSELAAAAAKAHADSLDKANAYLGQHVAPDGSLLVQLAAAEWSNSHWVDAPRVTEIATGRILLDLWDGDWDASVTFPRSRTVALSMRRYHFGGGLSAEIDLDREICVITSNVGETEEVPLAEIALGLEAAFQRFGLAGVPLTRPPPPREKRGGGSYKPALLILIGAGLAIAAATILTERLKPPPPAQKLTPMPKPPVLPIR
jgi:hypothetical protein